MTRSESILLWLPYASAGVALAGALGLLLAGLNGWACLLGLLVLAVSMPGWMALLPRVGPGRPYCVTGLPLMAVLALADLVAIHALLRLLVTFQ